MIAGVVLCSAFLLQTISAQCIGNPYGAIAPNGLPVNGPAGNGYGYGPPIAPAPYVPFAAGPCLSLAEISSSNGGGFRVTSSSPIAPSGVTVQTDSMLMEGPLAVTGQLPFLGVVALEGPLPAVGQGAVAYGCGNGNIGIVNEVLPAPEVPAYAGPAYGNPGVGYNGFQRGCGPIY